MVSLSRTQILFISSDDNFIKIIRNFMKSLDYRVDYSHDKKNGLAKYKTHNHDVVVIDQNLDDTNGLETIAQFSDPHSEQAPAIAKA